MYTPSEQEHGGALPAGAAFGFTFFSDGHILFNGNLHWTAFNSFKNIWIRSFNLEPQGYSIVSFDIETKCFSTFSGPPVHVLVGEGGVTVLRDCLCYSYMTCDKAFVIWMMKEYQVEESWTIEYKICTTGFDFYFDCVLDPIKIFKDGDMLMLSNENRFMARFYSNKTRTIQQVGMFKDAVAGYFTALIFTPSFFSLKNLDSRMRSRFSS